MGKIRCALLSVYDKEGLEDLAGGLQRHGVRLLSSGGTAARLREAGIPVTEVSDYTGDAEILSGRVKTLHPRICGGILARDTAEHRAELEQHRIEPIDLVVVNLYPFEATLKDPAADEQKIVEMIDIGGVTLIRAAAKNHERVTVVVDPEDYTRVLDALDEGDGEVDAELRLHLARTAFARTAAYDAAIAAHFQASSDDPLPRMRTVPLHLVQDLRYGENPHQRAALYGDPLCQLAPAVVGCEQIQGKALSYNNILDADAALNLALELPEPAVCVIKHTNPCGAATAADVGEAFKRALATDPVSAFGGIVSSNRPVTAEMAAQMREIFLEAVIAPAYDEDALKLLGRKKKLRVLRYDGDHHRRGGLVMRSVSGGVLMQEFDAQLESMAEARVVTRRAPTEAELRALDFAWRICKHVKSNAIVFGKEDQLVGVGAGQMSRVDSVRLAATKAQLPLAGTVLASDAFFPFRDGLDAAHEAGATAVVEPGGSVRDQEVIDAADEHGMAMIFTGSRHFRH